jgi:hypothetical protein
MLQQEIENGKLLVEKASAGDTAAVEYLLERGVRVNAEAYSQSLYYKLKNHDPVHVEVATVRECFLNGYLNNHSNQHNDAVFYCT